MAASTRKPEFAWNAKLTWSTWQCERVRMPRDEPDAEEASAEERARPEEGVAEAAEEIVTVSIPVCFVDFLRAGCERVRFRVNPQGDGQFTFSDRREREAGTLGTTGLWGTLPPLRAPKPRTLTPTSFKVEAARFVGAERAEEIVTEVITSPRFFSSDLRQL